MEQRALPPIAAAHGQPRYSTMTDDPHPILVEIARFLRDNPHITAAKLGWLALKDSCFVDDVRRGRDVRRKTAQRVRSFMERAAPLGGEDA